MTPVDRRRPRWLILAALVVVVALTAIGTVAWIVKYMNPEPVVPPAPVVARRVEGGVLVFTVALPGRDPIDRLGASVAALGVALASGRVPGADRVRAVAIEAPAPALRLVFDRAVLQAGAASGQTADHLLGLAGSGTRWPDARAAWRYCGRLETSRGAFCERVRG